MFEAILLEIIKNVVVPELVELIKRKFIETGNWPTKEELDLMVDAKAQSIIQNGVNFLNRPPEG